MLTVLVKKPDNTEVIYECSSVEKEENAILLRGDQLGSGDCRGLEVLGPGGQTMAWDWDRNSTRDSVDHLSKPANVFVMNDSGKTVARYSLHSNSVDCTADVAELCNQVRIVPLKANDRNNDIYLVEGEEIYLYPDEEISLFDISRPAVFGYGHVDRTEIIAKGTTIDGLIIEISRLDDCSIKTTLTVKPNDRMPRPTFMQIEVQRTGKEELESLFHFHLGEDNHIHENTNPNFDQVIKYLKTKLPSSPPGVSLQVGVNGTLDRLTGSLCVYQTGDDNLGEYKITIVGYSVAAHYHKE